VSDAQDPALTKFLWLTLMRVGGAVAALVGLLLWRTATFGAPNEDAGRILFIVGLFASLMVPALLARRWRRRP
jgi:hypothetical protein